jgi:hypothetical protein
VRQALSGPDLTASEPNVLAGVLDMAERRRRRPDRRAAADGDGAEAADTYKVGLFTP